MRKRVVLVSAAVAAVVATAGWWSVDRALRPEVRGGSGMQLGTGFTSGQDHMLLYVDDLCVDGARRATVTDVAPVRAQGATVSDFGLQVPEGEGPGIGAMDGRLSEVPDVTWTRAIEVTCSGSPDGPASLVVELQRVGAGDGEVDGLRIRYRVDGEERTAVSSAHVTLCTSRPDPCSATP